MDIYKSEYKTLNVNQVMFGLNVSRFLDFKERTEKMFLKWSQTSYALHTYDCFMNAFVEVEMF